MLIEPQLYCSVCSCLCLNERDNGIVQQKTPETFLSCIIKSCEIAVSCISLSIDSDLIVEHIT
jgi:hypothetical protein